MAWLVRFALDAMMPTTDALPGCAELGLDAFVTRFLSEASWLMWLGAVGASLAFMLLPIATIYVPLPAVLLPRSALDRHAQRMASHPLYLLRQAAFMVRMVAGLHWGAQPAARAKLGMEPYGPDPGTWRSA